MRFCVSCAHFFRTNLSHSSAYCFIFTGPLSLKALVSPQGPPAPPSPPLPPPLHKNLVSLLPNAMLDITRTTTSVQRAKTSAMYVYLPSLTHSFADDRSIDSQQPSSPTPNLLPNMKNAVYYGQAKFSRARSPWRWNVYSFRLDC